MTEHRDPLDDELPVPERNQRERLARVKQIIAEIRAEHLSEKDPA